MDPEPTNPPHRPISGDPGAEPIMEYLDLNEGEPWLMAHWGDYTVFAAETMTRDGGSYQRVVAMDLPVRENHGTEAKRLRLFITPALAAELASDFANALRYIV